MLVGLYSGIVVEEPGGDFKQSRTAGWIRHRRSASAAERRAIGGWLAQNRRLVVGDQLSAGNEAEIFDAHIQPREKCGSGHFAASRTMAQLKRPRRFGELEADRAAKATYVDHFSTFCLVSLSDRTPRFVERADPCCQPLSSRSAMIQTMTSPTPSSSHSTCCVPSIK